MATSGDSADHSLWAPFRRRAFLWLWVSMFLATIGGWMQTVGAQWLLIDLPNAASVVALVQAATMTPMMLLALPAGVLADSLDRRWLLLFVAFHLMATGALLAALTFAGLMTPALLLVFTFAIGMGMAVQIPTWQSLMPELVPRSQLRAVARLDMVSVNLARALGPAIGGFVIARAGVPWVFVAQVCSVFFLVGALILWRRPRTEIAHRERFLPAMRAGGRYAWNEPSFRRTLARQSVFVFPASVLWALLPVVAKRVLDIGADRYGLLFGSLGIGAVIGALIVGRLRARLSANAVTVFATVLFGAAAMSLVFVPGFWPALVVTLIAGIGWTSFLSTLMSEVQVFLPNWIRARALALLMVSFTMAQIVGALVWGSLAEAAGITTAWLVATGLIIASSLVAVVWKLPDLGASRSEPVDFWGDVPDLVFEPNPDDGPVMVTIEYVVSPDRLAAFEALWPRLRLSRLHTGATRWEMYRSGERPDTYVEFFTVASWGEHEKQHTGGRLTKADKEVEDRIAALCDLPPMPEHLLPPPRTV